MLCNADDDKKLKTQNEKHKEKRQKKAAKPKPNQISNEKLLLFSWPGSFQLAVFPAIWR